MTLLKSPRGAQPLVTPAQALDVNTEPPDDSSPQPFKTFQATDFEESTSFIYHLEIHKQNLILEKRVKLRSILQNHWPLLFKKVPGGFPGGAVVENLPANAGDTGSSPGLGGSCMPRSN